MRNLLDTHLYVWWPADDRPLLKAADALIKEQDDEVFVSTDSIREISIKAAPNQIRVDPAGIAESIHNYGLQELPILSKHAIETGKLPHHHRDPFDRLLIAQSRVEPMYLLPPRPGACRLRRHHSDRINPPMLTIAKKCLRPPRTDGDGRVEEHCPALQAGLPGRLIGENAVSRRIFQLISIDYRGGQSQV